MTNQEYFVYAMKELRAKNDESNIIICTRTLFIRDSNEKMEFCYIECHNIT